MPNAHRRQNILSVSGRSAAAAALAVLLVEALRGEEFVLRELELAEKGAGILVGHADAFLFGYAEIVGGDEELQRALQTNDGKQPQCNVNPPAVAAAVNLVVKAPAHIVRQRRDIAVAAAFLTRIDDLRVKANWVDYLDDGFGHIGLFRYLRIDAVRPIFGREYPRGALAAEEYHLFVECGKTLDRVRLAYADKGVERDFEEILDVDRIEASVEGDVFHVDVNPNDFGFTAPDVNSLIHDCLPASGEVYRKILQAILVFAGIIHAVGADANGFLKAAMTTAERPR